MPVWEGMDEKMDIVIKKRAPKRGRKKNYKMYPKRSRLFISRGLRAPVPYQLKTALLYQERVNLAPAAGVAGVHVFSANGLYDPNITGVGHQPRGFDQMMALYDHCVCIWSEIEVEYPQVGVGGNRNPCIGFVSAKDFTTVGTTITDYLELGDRVYKTLSTEGGYVTRLTMAINPNKYLGRSSPLSDPNLKNSSGGNPTEQVYWHVGAAQVSGLDPTAIPANVVIKYTVVFIEPKDPGAS